MRRQEPPGQDVLDLIEQGTGWNLSLCAKKLLETATAKGGARAWAVR
jgi:hypothetical protein